MSKNKKTWVEFRKKTEDDINWAGLKEQLDDSGKKKDTHFDKLRKVKDQINKQKEKIGKIDISDPKQRTPHAIARADLKSMNLKLKDMQVTDNEPETDDKGKPSKKKYIKEFLNFKSITFKPKGQYVSDGKYEIIYYDGRRTLVTKKQLNVWLKDKFIEENFELEERSLADLKARRAKVKQTLDRVSKEKGSTVGINDPEYKELKHLDTLIKNYSEEFELNEASSKLPFLVGESIAHLELYLELVNELKKVPPGKEIPYMSKIKAETASKSLPMLIRKLKAPNIWRENVEEAQQPGFAVRYTVDGKRKVQAYKTKDDAEQRVNVLKYGAPTVGSKVSDISITKHDLNFKEELDETAYTDWLKKIHSKELRQLDVQDIKKYADLWTTHKQKQFQTLRVNKGSRQTPIAAELEPDTIKKEDVVREVSPPGWEGTVRAMKKHPELGGEKGDKNIYALSWYLKNKGAKSHYKDKGGKPMKKDKYKEEKIKVNEGYDEDIHFGISGLETDRQTIEEEKQMDKKYFKTKIGSVEDNINKIRVEQPTVKIEKPKVILQTKSYFDQKEGSLADTAAKVVSEKVITEAKYTIGYEIDSDSGADDKYIGEDEMNVSASSSRDAAKKFGQAMNKVVKKAGQRSQSILKISMTSFEDNNRDYNDSEINKLDDYANGFIYKGIYDSYSIKEDDSLIKKAIEIAKKMAGNMTGATKAIEKLARGLSKEKDVSTALAQANEEIKTEARSPEEQKKQDKMMKDFLAKGGKVKKLKPGIAKGAGHLDLRGPYKKDMLAASAVYKAPTTKYKKTTLAAQKSFKDLRSETDQKEVEKDLVATKVGGKGKTLTGKKPAVIDTEPKVNPI